MSDFFSAFWLQLEFVAGSQSSSCSRASDLDRSRDSSGAGAVGEVARVAAMGDGLFHCIKLYLCMLIASLE